MFEKTYEALDRLRQLADRMNARPQGEYRFLRALGYQDHEFDTLDIEYLKDVHWELWERYR